MNHPRQYCPGSGSPAPRTGLVREGRYLKARCPDCGRMVRTREAVDDEHEFSDHRVDTARYAELERSSVKTANADEELNKLRRILSTTVVGNIHPEGFAAALWRDVDPSALPARFWASKGLFLQYASCLLAGAHVDIDAPLPGFVRISAMGTYGISDDLQDAWQRLLIRLRQEHDAILEYGGDPARRALLERVPVVLDPQRLTARPS